MFADITYEGARSVVGPYFKYLDAALVVAAAVSLGDLVSYTARLFGGFIAHLARSSRAYWGLVFLGYAVNLVAVPLLAFAGNWQLAFALVILERAGKGVRAPARDAILAEVSQGIGRGLAYSIHEALDQVGAVAGPLAVGIAMSVGDYGYREAFLALSVPAAISMLLLLASILVYPTLEEARAPSTGHGLPRRFWVFAVSAMASMAGFIHWIHASYRLSYLGPSYIALYYSLAMLVDALAALVLGMSYDRIGRSVVLVVPLVAGASTILIAWEAGPVYFAIAWGIAMGGFESIYRSVVADDLSPGLRGLGFGILYFMMGVGWSLGNLSLSYMKDPGSQTLFVVLVESLSLIMLGLYLKQGKRFSNPTRSL